MSWTCLLITSRLPWCGQHKAIANGDEPYFVDVPELDEVWATGCTFEDARGNFIEAPFGLDSSAPAMGQDISQMGGQS